LQAAALPLAGVTAYRSLFTRAQLKAGERVLITGIGGGVALFALQFALAAGAKVYVTSGSDTKLERAQTLGASGGSNYHNSNWAEVLKALAGAFDVIVDSAGGAGFSKLTDLAAPAGRLVFFGATQGNPSELAMRQVFWKQLSLLGSTMGTDADFADMVRYVNDNKITPVVDQVFDLANAETAIQRMANLDQFGKIVLEV
jgi:NADPH:quinone reductase-like Zn-dependent oxidoreductase